MNDRPARKVERTGNRRCIRIIGQKSTAPNHMAERAINKNSPEDRKNDHRAEFHSFRKRTTNQCRGDDEEHALEEHVPTALGYSDRDVPERRNVLR